MRWRKEGGWRNASLRSAQLTAEHTLVRVVVPGDGLDARVVGGRAARDDDAVLARD